MPCKSLRILWREDYWTSHPLVVKKNAWGCHHNLWSKMTNRTWAIHHVILGRPFGHPFWFSLGIFGHFLLQRKMEQFPACAEFVMFPDFISGNLSRSCVCGLLTMLQSTIRMWKVGDSADELVKPLLLLGSNPDIYHWSAFRFGIWDLCCIKR